MGTPLRVAMTRSLNARGSTTRPIVRSVCSRVVAGDVAAGQVGVLPRQRVAHGGDRQLVGGQPVGVHPHVDRALEAADDLDLADAAGALEERLDDLVGDLGQLAQRPVGRHARW